MKTIIEGRERIMSAVTPTPHPNEHAASDLYFMHSQASHEWCQKARVAPAKDDPIVRTLEALAREARRRSTLRAHPLTLSQSFVFDRVVHGQPFYRALMAADWSQWPHHRLRDFAEDPRMVASVRALANTGVPYVLVHLASYWELKAGQEYVRVVDPAQERALLDSLARLAARPVYGTLDHAKLPIQGLEGLSRKFPRDLHPSRRGAEFYAEVVAEVLQRHGYVNPSARPRSPQPSLSSR